MGYLVHIGCGSHNSQVDVYHGNWIRLFNIFAQPLVPRFDSKVSHILLDGMVIVEEILYCGSILCLWMLNPFFEFICLVLQRLMRCYDILRRMAFILLNKVSYVFGLGEYGCCEKF